MQEPNFKKLLKNIEFTQEIKNTNCLDFYNAFKTNHNTLYAHGTVDINHTKGVYSWLLSILGIIPKEISNAHFCHTIYTNNDLTETWVR